MSMIQDDTATASATEAREPTEATEAAERPVLTADVCVIGAGLVGLANALQYARRGLSVVLVDELTPAQCADYKVGESLLVFSNAFLRTIGELDDELSTSFVKQGFWMAYGLEGKTGFDLTTSEFGFLAQLPDRWRAAVSNEALVRAMAGDVQIVRPEIEAAMRTTVSKTEGITFCDQGLVRDVELGRDGQPHRLGWRSRDSARSGEVRARWIIDCSGRRRLLTRTFGHELALDDGFQTASAWGQFRDCPDELFGPEWEYRFPEGRTIRRDLDTVHLWGEGYWIWLIRLTDHRLSVGVTLDRSRFDDLTNLREVFWQIVGRYPMLSFLTPETLLQFHALREVQYLTDTYVSADRYALAGDAASIIDPLYSQGLSLSLSTSWHVANIVQRDLEEAVLDTGYLEQVNAATRADWQLLRSMVRGKYSPAIADSRFFVLDHLLDYLVLSAALLPRYQVSRWLTETGGRPTAETGDHPRLRATLKRTLYLTQCPPLHLLAPQRVADLAERWHAGLARRAVWRLDNGIRLKPTRAVLRADAAIPLIWKLPFLRFTESGELTPRILLEPSFVRVKGTETSPLLLRGAGAVLLLVNLACLGYDVVDTAARKPVVSWRSGRPQRRAAQARQQLVGGLRTWAAAGSRPAQL